MNFDTHMAVFSDIFLQHIGFIKSSSITAAIAFNPDDTVLKVNIKYVCNVTIFFFYFHTEILQYNFFINY